MKEIKFDIIKFAYIENETPDVSFIPMLLRRKLNSFGRAALFTLYKTYEKENVNLVFSSDYGDFERVKKLVAQRKDEGEISPTGFSFSVHNASVGLFSLLEKIKTGYNSVSAGKNSLPYGFLEGILSSAKIPALYCYTESLEKLQSVSVLISQNPNGKYLLSENNTGSSLNGFSDFIKFLEGEKDSFSCDLYSVKRI